MSDTTSTSQGPAQDAYGATDADVLEGSVVTVGGGDWDDVVDTARMGEERIVVNMGPQHPSTHGVLRLILEVEGETVTEARAGIGYLHTGIEKNMEVRSWTQGVTFCTRMDYLSPIFNETAYCLGIEKMLGITEQVPERASVLRVLTMELNRIGSHAVALATGGMELGSTTMMTDGFRERDKALEILEEITGLRMNHAFVRPGGVSQDIPPGALDSIREFVPSIRRGIRELELLAAQNPDAAPTAGRHRLPQPGRLPGPGHHRPRAALHGPAQRPAQGRAVLRLRGLRLRGHHPHRRRQLLAAADPRGRDVRVGPDHRAVHGEAAASGPWPGHGGRPQDQVAVPAVAGR
jgi:hypothetical protein